MTADDTLGNLLLDLLMQVRPDDEPDDDGNEEAILDSTSALMDFLATRYTGGIVSAESDAMGAMRSLADRLGYDDPDLEIIRDWIDPLPAEPEPEPPDPFEAWLERQDVLTISGGSLIIECICPDVAGGGACRSLGCDPKCPVCGEEVQP